MKTILIITALTFSLAGKSQDSLLFYLSEAAKNNPTVMQKYAEYQAALQKVPQVGSLPEPEFTMGVFLSPMELVSGNQVADLRLMQMFPWFGTLRAAKDEMSLMANAKYELFREAKLQVFFEVQTTWFDLYKLAQNLLISEKNIEILKTLERIALVKFRNVPSENSPDQPSGTSGPSGVVPGATSGTQGMSGGMGGNGGVSTATASNGMSQSGSMSTTSEGSSLADLYRIQIEKGDLENNLALLKDQQNSLIAKFNSFLDRSPASPVSLPDTLISDTLGIPLRATYDSMLTNNPMLGMLQYEQQSLDSRKKMVTRMGYPMIGLGVNYSVISRNEMVTSTMNGKDMIMPMVTLTLPIYRKKYRAMQNEAELQKTASEQNYKAAANNLETEYYQAVQLYQDARRRIDLYGSQSLLADRSLQITIRQFAVSGSGLTDVLRIRQQNLDYENKKIEAIVDFNTAIAWLNRLMAFQQ
jgi:outer membrane protein TolC